MQRPPRRRVGGARPPDFIGTCCALLDADFVAATGGIADPRFAGYGSEDVDLCWRIGERGGQVARTAAVYVHHFHNSSLIDNEVDGEAKLCTANRILYAKWGPTDRAGAGGNPTREFAAGILSAHFIFQPLSRHTTFIADLPRGHGPHDIPDQVIWQPDGL